MKMRVKRRKYCAANARIRIYFPDGGYFAYRRNDRNWKKKLAELFKWAQLRE